QAEFVFSIMKLTLIIGLIITGLVIDLGGAPTKDRLGFRYWKNPGVFARAHLIQHNVDLDRFLGVVSVIVQAAFSFQGMEIAAIAASETESPRRNIAKAIRKSFFRILIFYILGIFVAGLIVPSNNLLLLQRAAAVSPYVIAMKCVSMRVLPQVVNAGFITSAFSAGNSFLFAASRILFGLALQKQAPSFFLKTKNGVPIVAVLFTASFGLLSLLGMSQQPQQVFQWFVYLTTVGDFFSWATINLTYIFFYRGLKQQGKDRKELQYWCRFQPWLSIWGVVWCTIFILISGFQVFWRFNASDFLSAYINIPIFIGLYLLWKLTKKTEIWTPEEMDFDTGIPTLEETELPYRKPHGFWGKFADAVF
ncbi:amino acid permease/ SLC12A domain-containing protein, partial [Scleroderma citrinum]